MAGSPFDLSALYRAPVTVCSSQGIGRYRATLASRDRLVLDLDDVPERAVRPEVGDLVSVGCADPAGWLTGDVRVIEKRPNRLVTTSPELQMAQRRAAHRVAVALPMVVEVEEDGEVLSVVGETIDVSALGFSAQVAPASISEGEAVQARLTLPNGHEVAGLVDVVAGGSVIRARWTAVPERSRDRIVGVINQVQASRLRRD